MFYVAVMLGLLSLGDGLPQTVSRVREEGCGLDRMTGEPRGEGDTWSPDGCNRCHCLKALVPGCTKKLCPGQGLCPQGAQWAETTRGQDRNCSCSEGGTAITCTAPAHATSLAPGLKADPRADSMVNFPGLDTRQEHSRQLDLPEAADQVCLDSQEQQREEGESWKQDCNICRCLGGRVACTRRFCVTSHQGDINSLTKEQPK